MPVCGLLKVAGVEVTNEVFRRFTKILGCFMGLILGCDLKQIFESFPPLVGSFIAGAFSHL